MFSFFFGQYGTELAIGGYDEDRVRGPLIWIPLILQVCRLSVVEPRARLYFCDIYILSLVALLRLLKAWWTLRLDGIYVNGAQVSGSAAVILDSGTSLLSGPPAQVCFDTRFTASLLLT